MTGGSAGALPVIVVVGALLVSFLVQKRLSSHYDYRCEGCGHTFSLSPVAMVVAPHRIGGRKWVKCPSCGRLSWVTPVSRE